MPSNLSRRAVAQGLAWSVPAVATAAAAPAFAASGCNPAAKAAIDAAFTSVTNALVAYWTIDTVSQLDGQGGARPYLNINNNTLFDLSVSETPLSVTQYAYFQESGAPRPNLTLVTSSYGTVSPWTGTVYDGHQADTWTWSAGGGEVILGARSGDVDNTADIVFTNRGSLVRNPPGTVVCSVLNSAPDLKPTFASIQVQNSAVTEACKTYYDAKAAVTPVISFSGPLLQGTTPWNHDGKSFTLNGGSTTWSVGGTVCSNAVGNYVSDTYPPSAHGIPYGYNGIF